MPAWSSELAYYCWVDLDLEVPAVLAGTYVLILEKEVNMTALLNTAQLVDPVQGILVLAYQNPAQTWARYLLSEEDPQARAKEIIELSHQLFEQYPLFEVVWAAYVRDEDGRPKQGRYGLVVRRNGSVSVRKIRPEDFVLGVV